jgi:hypothetical protein
VNGNRNYFYSPPPLEQTDNPKRDASHFKIFENRRFIAHRKDLKKAFLHIYSRSIKYIISKNRDCFDSHNIKLNVRHILPKFRIIRDIFISLPISENFVNINHKSIFVHKTNNEFLS